MLISINAGDTAWVLISTLLVFLMTFGFSFFYAGLTQQRDVQTLLKQTLMVICLVSLQWILFGYSLSFGPDHGGWIGTLAWAGLRSVGGEPSLEYAGTVPHLAFMLYRMMFAVLSPTLVLAIFAERIKFSAACVFALLWTTIVYDPLVHWVWGVGGFLRNSGVLDFAGGSIVHLSAGVAILVMALALGKRPKDDQKHASDQNQRMAVLGGIVLWLGWFGFNTGNALAAGSLTVSAFTATHAAAAAGGLTWSLLDNFLAKSVHLVGIVAGALVGLIAVSPASGYVTIWGALGIGAGVTTLTYASFVLMERKFGAEDSLFAVTAHGIGGIGGMIGTGLWAAKSVNAGGDDGLFNGNFGQFIIQIKATMAIIIYVFLMTWILLKFVDLVVGLRARPANS